VSLIDFLNELRRHFRGRRLILIWDGLPSHKSRAMTTHLQTQRSWLTAERLPGYAPELNPTELVWGNVKGRELANLCADNLSDVERAVRTGLRRVRTGPHAGVRLLRHAGLSV
jgi:transposase